MLSRLDQLTARTQKFENVCSHYHYQDMSECRYLITVRHMVYSITAVYGGK